MADTIGVQPVAGQNPLSINAASEKHTLVDMGDEKTDRKGPGEAKEDHGGYMRIFTYAGRTEYIILGVAAFAAIASGAAIALQNLVFGRFVTVLTDFTSGKSTGADMRRDSSTLALYFVYIGIGRFVLAYTYNSLLTYNAYRIVRNIRYAYLKAALSQEIAFFDLGTGGSISTQATTNGRLIQGGISEKLGLTFQGLSAFVTGFIVAFATNWKLTLITLCIAPATIVVMAVTGIIEAGLETKILDIYAQANSFSEGVLASARTVHAFEMRSRLVNKFDEYLIEAHRVGNKISPLFGILFSSEYCIIYLGFGLAFWQGVHMLGRGEIKSSGEVFTVLLSVVIAAVSLTSLAPYFIEFTRAASGAAQLFTLIDRQSAIDPFDESGQKPSDVVGHIELENVTFSYPSRPGTNVLDAFTLDIPSGKVTALVGQSGSGKSTIIGLIERWYNVTSGSIKLDGREIKDLNINWLRKNVRLVQQEPVLFQGSVFENIAYGLIGTEWQDAPKEVQLEKIKEAAKMAFADDFITELPDGYDTQIGQRGGLLSGGQKQRVAIARSIVSQPKVLLLDEATSALDPHAEGVVQQALDRASKGRTTIVIAHKLATIRKADNIVVMKAGRIVEQGTHESLLAEDGAYAQLVKIQNLTLKPSESDSESDDTDDEVTAGDPADLAKPMSKIATRDRARMEMRKDRDDYDKHKQLGFITVIFRLVKESPELRWTYLLVFLGCAGASAAFPGQALLLANVTNVFTLTGSAMVDRGNFFAAMFIVLAVGCFISYFILGYTTNIVAQTLSHRFRRQTFNDMLRQDLQFFDRTANNTGALASRVDSNPQAILELMGFNVGLILIAVLNVLACSILGIAYSWKLGLVVVLAGLPPFIGSGWFKIRFDAKLDRAISKRNSNSAAIASEAVTAIRTVSSLAIEESVLDKYLTELEHAVSGSVKPLFSMMVWFALTQSIEYWFMALGFWYGCRLVSFREISMFDFFVTFMGVFFSGQATTQLFQFSTSMTKGKNAANYIFWLHELQPTVQETPENQDKGPKSGGPIVLDHVRFSYPLRPDTQVLRGVDLEIRKGQFAAFVGASGCGKSTMIAMLERFYDPSTGNIYIDGDDLTTLNPRLYRKMVSLVQQEPTLFQGSIRENIALGIDDPSPSSSPKSPTTVGTTVADAQIEAALRSANAWDFVSSLPDGLSTAAGSNGTQLSGGQRQRIAIARSLIRNPKVLLLDEATSALDTESEKIVQSALAEAAQEGDRITIAVAHRLSTIKDADVICVFYGGKIVEMGTHGELLAHGGMYKKMCEAQSLD
ncbi:ATP-binding cassette multidrug transport protein ATRC [Metarhizium guizhouense ARSEF 977]|uniref:ATP-binding cassette multidrug transport protein ATRC n=1 Tax=Metarhizium guizhouense (strain ARSEF 977) TaxID=1276136 RepID=A0A0B4H4D7_METGA|nr:ATP-binding cassette multidrug transport protein ATRC [Metarhizium guizhouense ARSEF 977]